MEITEQLVNAINNSKVVAVFIHVKPDGDCIGAGMALKYALTDLGKKVDVYCDGTVSKNFDYLTDIKCINSPKYTRYDTAIAVDIPTFARIGCYAELYKTPKCRINIDHHKTNECFGDINLVDGSRASACEIVYELFKVMDVKFTRQIAEALYTGVNTDTGCFMHANTMPITHIIASDLLSVGIDSGKINTMIYKSKTMGQIELQKIALNHMAFYFKNKVCISYITKHDFIDTKTTNNDTIGLIDTFIGIDGVEIGIVLSEDKPGICAVSMRSKGDIDVSKLCEYFGGGGHKNAAGCNIFGTAKTALNKIIKAIEEVYAGIY